MNTWNYKKEKGYMPTAYQGDGWMKRKGLRILLASAVLSFGLCTISAFAAEGWALSNNTWVYLDKYGQRMTNVWKKGADNLWRYLDSKGEMAINTWADDDYYVDSNGIMVTDTWEKIRPQYSSNADLEWFYFGSSGKVVRDGWKKIDGKSYLFDSEGVMVTGWSEDGMYYLGSDGAMRTGWRYLEPSDAEDWYDYSTPESGEMYWYYFGSNGKKYTPATSDDSGEYKVYKIDGKYYCFNYNGQMQTGWVYMEGDPDSASSETIEGWRYFAEEEIQSVPLGSVVSGWLSLEPPEVLQNNMDDPVQWYYFENDGTPKFSPSSEDISTDDFTRISGKTYLFNQYGNPVSGLQLVQIGDTGEYTTYYFDESSRTPLKGKQRIEEDDGTVSDFYFNEGSYAGRGVTGVKNGYLYYMGKRQEADSDWRYMPISIQTDDGYETYVVNTSGRVSKGTTVKDRDGNKYKVNSTGLLEEYNDEAVGNEKFEDPIAPVVENE